MVTNPNIGLKPARSRGGRAHPPASVPAAPGAIRLPSQGVLREQGSRRRRRAQLRLPETPRLDLGARVRFSNFGRVYILLAGVVVTTLLYLVQAAGATAASYEIGRLQAQQSDLLAEQDHLKYQEASLKSPSQVEAQAATAGLTRPNAYRYVPYQNAGLAFDSAPPAAPDQSPLWEKALASLTKAVSGGQDAFAAGR